MHAVVQLRAFAMERAFDKGTTGAAAARRASYLDQHPFGGNRGARNRFTSVADLARLRASHLEATSRGHPRRRPHQRRHRRRADQRRPWTRRDQG